VTADPFITESEVRFDGVAMNALAMLQNRMTGLGQSGRDKYLETDIATDFTPLNRPQLQALYRKSAECEKVVDLLPKSATAENWIEVTIGKGRKGLPAKAVQYSEDLKLRDVIREAGIMGRLDGDGFVIIGVDDGGLPIEPVNEGRIRKISWLYPVDRWRVIPDTTTGRPGHPEFYNLYLPATEALPSDQTMGKIHKSRVLRLPGKRLWGDMSLYNSGYNDSVLQTFFPAFVQYLIAIEYSTRMVQDYNQFVYKLQGLAQLILAGEEEKIFKRFQAILMSMSTLGGLAMDADREDGQFISRNFSGLDALIDKLKDRASGASKLPPTKLWGSSQKTALSNSAEGDKYEWADCVADYRSEILADPVHDFFRLVFLAQNGPTGGRIPESWGISYRSALRLNLKEQTALRKDQTMGVDVPSVQNGILLPEEVRESAWSGSEYTIERQLQPDLWAKQQAEAEQKAQPLQPQPGAGDGVDNNGNGDRPSLEPRTDDATPAKRILDWHGFKLGLQYQPFDIRHGKVLPVAYGHIQKTRGADGMACDCYVGPNLESDRVFEVTQLVNGQFDEHKYMLGFDSLEDARDTFLKVMPAAMFGGIREVGLAGLEAYRSDRGSEAPNPKAPNGGTSRTDTDNPIPSLIDRADKLLQTLEDSAIERVNSALESSYQNLEAKILRSYSSQALGALMARDRAVVLLSQVADLLQLINTRNADTIQQAFEDLLRGADAQGVTLAQDLTRAIANQSLQMTAQIPLAAIANQAAEGMTRLRNHIEAFADKASTIVSQGLIQGWGTDKVASLLRQELGVVQHRAETIARTESLSASNGAAIATYQANGIDLATWQATADDRLCGYCAARNQKIYHLEDLVLPAHPRCRCFASPASESWLRLGLLDTKWAADFRAKSLAELRSQGLEPNDGQTPFEKANGIDAPVAVWEPGQHLDSVDWDEWHEDGNGIPCGKGWIKAGHKCSKGVSSHHAAANPSHPNHAAYQGALAAATGIHNHAASNPSHPVHAAYKAGFDAHGGTAPLPSAGGGGSGSNAAPAKKAATKKAASGGSASTAGAAAPATPAQPAAPKTTKRSTKKTAATAPASTANTSPVKLNDAGLQAARADLEQRFGKKLVSDAEANTKKLLGDADVFVRIKSADTLEKVLGGGFKTSAELNVTDHSIPHLADKNYQDARNRVEAKTLGYDAKNTAPGDRPIYGYLGSSDLNGQSHADVSRTYGSIAVKLKSDVKDRTSFTGADSFKSGIASEVNNPNAASLVSLTRHGYDRDQLPKHYPSYMRGDQNDKSMLQHAATAHSLDDLAPHLSPTGNAYVEAQVHGGVKPSDIAEIHFSPSGLSDRPNAAIAQFAKDNNVPLYVNGNKLSHGDLDNIITPPKDLRSQRVKDLKDALDRGDIDAVADIADKIHTDSKNVKLAPGESDKVLKLLYSESGFDAKPQVGTKADLDQAAQNGQTMMARGVRKGNPPNQFHDQFKTGDYFTGNGIYGNGTYVGHSGSFSSDGLTFKPDGGKAGRKRAVSGVAKHNYINGSTINMRMALAKDAVVVTQKQMSSDIAALEQKVKAWAASEHQKILASVKKYTAADIKKHAAETTRVEQDYAGHLGKAKQTKTLGGFAGDDTYHITIPLAAGAPSHLTAPKFDIERETNLFGGTPTWNYTKADGSKGSAKTLKAAIAAGTQAHYAKEAAARLGFKDVPTTGTPTLTKAQRQQLQDVDDRASRIADVLYGDQGNGASGRYAVIHGIDAIALNGSYEPKTFMNLLNRSKVLIEDTPFKYHAGVSV